MSEVSGVIFGVGLVAALITGLMSGLGLYWLIQRSSINMWERRERTK